MPRFLQALPFLRPKVVAAPPAPASPLATLVAAVRDHTPAFARRAVEDFLRDKSQSEVLFLTSILLAVVLFVVILPACEALFGYDEEDREERDAPSKMRMYKPGVGVVEVDASAIADKTPLQRWSSGGSSRSSIGSCSMETIEESEEEYLEDDDDDGPEEEGEVHSIDGSQHQESETSQQGKPVFAEGETVNDKAKYFEFLEFINSESKTPQAPDLDESLDLSVESEGR